LAKITIILHKNTTKNFVKNNHLFKKYLTIKIPKKKSLHNNVNSLNMKM